MRKSDLYFINLLLNINLIIKFFKNLIISDFLFSEKVIPRNVALCHRTNVLRLEPWKREWK